MTPPIITWDYQFAPNAQKSRNYMYATGTDFKVCEQPFVMPRPIMEKIGIKYRRIPVNSIGKDVFCDNVPFIQGLQSLLEKEGKGLKRGPYDNAFDAWGYRSFWSALPCVPGQLMTKDLAKDRATLFPVFTRADFGTLQQNGLSELRSMLDVIEDGFLSHGGKWIGGSDAGIADINSMWMIKWALQTLDIEKQPGFGEDSYPKVHAWINNVKRHNEEAEKGQKIDEETAIKQILESDYALPLIGVDSTDPLKLQEGDTVEVEAADITPGSNPQRGKLVGLSKSKVVIQLDNGLRVHFPRIGYFIYRRSETANGS